MRVGRSQCWPQVGYKTEFHLRTQRLSRKKAALNGDVIEAAAPRPRAVEKVSAGRFCIVVSPSYLQSLVRHAARRSGRFSRVRLEPRDRFRRRNVIIPSPAVTFFVITPKPVGASFRPRNNPGISQARPPPCGNGAGHALSYADKTTGRATRFRTHNGQRMRVIHDKRAPVRGIRTAGMADDGTVGDAFGMQARAIACDELERMFTGVPIEARRLTGPRSGCTATRAASGWKCMWARWRKAATGVSRPNRARTATGWAGWFRDLGICLEAAKRHNLDM